MHVLFFSFQFDHLHHEFGVGFVNWVGAGGWGGSFHCQGVHCQGDVRVLFKTCLFIYLLTLLSPYVMFVFMFVYS